MLLYLPIQFRHGCRIYLFPKGNMANPHEMYPNGGRRGLMKPAMAFLKACSPINILYPEPIPYPSTRMYHFDT